MKLEFFFDDIPLHTLDGCTIAPVEGEAEISFDNDGEWTVNAISIYGDNKETKKKELVRLDGAHPSGIYLTVHGALTMDKSWRDAIDDQVWDALSDERPYPSYREARTYAEV